MTNKFLLGFWGLISCMGFWEPFLILNNMDYNQFIDSKRHTQIERGIEAKFIPDKMFDYQKYVAKINLQKGRYANFLDTGTGKTVIELTIAHNHVLNSNKPSLIITPLAVAEQHIRESEKFEIPDVEHTKDGRFTKKIVLINYQRLHHLSPNDFECVILDESSILKNADGATRRAITNFMKRVKYRYLATATPSPNDFIELGTSSEAIGYLGYTDMLNRFFTNNEGTIKPQNLGTKWILKGHAERHFFEWVSSWSISMRKPSDLGFSDKNHILPELVTNYRSVKNPNMLIVDGQMQLFTKIAKGFREIRAEEKATVYERCDRAVYESKPYDTTVYWCNRNDEGDLIQSLDKNTYQIKGSMGIEEKEDMLLAFSRGQIKRLITKPKITAFGLNWQFCGHTSVFPTFSYEQYYQLIRRFWRYGRKDKVVVDVVHSEGQQRILDSINAKMIKADELYHELNSELNSEFRIQDNKHNKNIILPKFF